MQNKLDSYISQRRFRICDYFLSHSQLLLRSPKIENFSFNIDLIFQDVDFINLPTTLYGIKVTNIGKSDGQYNQYSIESSEKLFQIHAGFLLICENNLELQETSLGVLEFEGRDNIIGAL